MEELTTSTNPSSPMHHMRALTLSIALISAAATAQEDRPHFRGSIGIAGPSYRFDSDLAGFNDSVDAGLLQARFEFTSSRRFGGGIRIEHFATDRDEGLFRDPAVASDRGVQARNTSFLAHATFRFDQHRLTAPVRVGLLVNNLVLDDSLAADPETNYCSAGPCIEFEPELTVFRRGDVELSIYGQLGFGSGPTSIDIDGDGRDYDSWSGLAAIETGARLRLGHAQFGIAFIGRYHSMDRSDLEGNSFVYGYDSEFEGILLTAGVIF